MISTNALVPELSVTDYIASRRFYRDVLGFTLVYERRDEGFGFFALATAQLMLDQIGLGRDFSADGHPLSPPLGRGVNLQIRVSDLDALCARLQAAGITPLVPLETRHYRQGRTTAIQRQIVVADPDRYLLRLAQWDD